MPDDMKPHLTPEKLIGTRFPNDTFANIDVALIGFCPPPTQLAQYHPQETIEQYFIHVSPSSVKICLHNELRFLSIYHVYGGPVASALVEELAYYGIKTILAYGLAGGLNPESQKMGDFYLVEQAMTFDGTTPHYTDQKLTFSNQDLQKQLLKKSPFSRLHLVQAATSDAIYRESDAYLARAQAKGCDIVNCDSAHLYAVCQTVGLKCVQMGVLSDVAQLGSCEWESQLGDMLSATEQSAQSPLRVVNEVIQYYVETIITAGF